VVEAAGVQMLLLRLLALMALEDLAAAALADSDTAWEQKLIRLLEPLTQAAAAEAVRAPVVRQIQAALAVPAS